MTLSQLCQNHLLLAGSNRTGGYDGVDRMDGLILSVRSLGSLTIAPRVELIPTLASVNCPWHREFPRYEES